MTSEILKKQNSLIKQEADEILFEKKILAILGKFGNPHISGSYSLDLMTWRDLDLYLQTDMMSEKKFFELGAELCTALQASHMQFKNERTGTTNGGSPAGLYWGIYLGDERSDAWRIDIWAVGNDECQRLIRYSDAIKGRLSDESSNVILSIKSQCAQDVDYRKIYSSADIYDAVLGNGVRDLESFWNYLDKQS